MESAKKAVLSDTHSNKNVSVCVCASSAQQHPVRHTHTHTQTDTGTCRAPALLSLCLRSSFFPMSLFSRQHSFPCLLSPRSPLSLSHMIPKACHLLANIICGGKANASLALPFDLPSETPCDPPA